MAKRQRVRLIMADGFEVKDIKDFKDHFEQEKVLEYYEKGELLKWLRERYYDDEADALDQLDENSPDFLKMFCAIFGVNPDESADYVPPMGAYRTGCKDLPGAPSETTRDKTTNTQAQSEGLSVDDFFFFFINFRELFEQNGDTAWNQGNYGEALEWYQKVAMAGDVGKMYIVAQMYENGYGTEQNNAKAFEWYKRASDAGNSEATQKLATLQAQAEEFYQKGDTAWNKKDYSYALQWFRHAAELGSHDAMTKIGMMYEQGTATDGKFDYSEALIWYTKAASAGNAMAMFLVGKMYDEGRGFDKDYNKAGEWYEKAAAAGSEKAVQELKQRKKNMIAACVFLIVVALVIAGIIYWFISS